jgi:signal transduction histidine kinase
MERVQDLGRRARPGPVGRPAADRVRQQQEKHGLHPRHRRPPGAPEQILTDEVARTAILRNLLSNGITYTDRGEVRLRTRVRGPRLEISVADTGTGLPAGLTEHAFEELDDVAMIAVRRMTA